MKEDTRVEGPYEFGVKPKVNQNAASVKEAHDRRAEANQQILQMGAEAAVQEGFINMKDYKNLKMSVDLFKLNT